MGTEYIMENTTSWKRTCEVYISSAKSSSICYILVHYIIPKILLLSEFADSVLLIPESLYRLSAVHPLLR